MSGIKPKSAAFKANVLLALSLMPPSMRVFTIISLSICEDFYRLGSELGHLDFFGLILNITLILKGRITYYFLSLTEITKDHRDQIICSKSHH